MGGSFLEKALCLKIPKNRAAAISEPHHRRDINNMELLSHVFLGAGQVFYVSKTKMAIVQIKLIQKSLFTQTSNIVEHR